MTTRVLFSRQAARAVFAEVQRWVDRGLMEGGAAHESMLYPLSALVPASGAMITPLERVRCEDIGELVVTAAATPPDEVKAFSPANCHFAGDLETANALFNQQIDEMIGAMPRSGVHSKLHAHPFEGGCFLSGGDLHHGVTAPKARAWRQAQGLDTAILHVVYPDGAPARSEGPWKLLDEGALGQGLSGSITWRIHSWASTHQGADEEMVDLGDAAIVGDRHPSLRAARRKPYYLNKRGAAWCDRQKSDLRRAGYRVSRNVLPRGWRRYIIDMAHTQLLIALPPDFPHVAPRLLNVHRAWLDDFRPCPLPKNWRPSFSASLLTLVRDLEAHQP